MVSGPIYPNGTLDMGMVSTLSRTYAQAVAGITSRMFYSTSTSQFELEYMVNAAATAPTEIYLNEELHYPNGFNCTAVNAACVHADTNTLHVIANAGATTVSVTIVQK